VVNTAEVNAFALPGGYLYVNRGLIETPENESELASNLGLFPATEVLWLNMVAYAITEAIGGVPARGPGPFFVGAGRRAMFPAPTTP